MSWQPSAARQLSAAVVLLRTLDQLPVGLVTDLWRHADICHLTRRGTCRQVRWLLREHLLAPLLTAKDWQPAWDAEATLCTLLDLRRLPLLLTGME